MRVTYADTLRNPWRQQQRVSRRHEAELRPLGHARVPSVRLGYPTCTVLASRDTASRQRIVDACIERSAVSPCAVLLGNGTHHLRHVLKKRMLLRRSLHCHGHPQCAQPLRPFLVLQLDLFDARGQIPRHL
jgi:hypothetical protein